MRVLIHEAEVGGCLAFYDSRFLLAGFVEGSGSSSSSIDSRQEDDDHVFAVLDRLEKEEVG